MSKKLGMKTFCFDQKLWGEKLLQEKYRWLLDCPLNLKRRTIGVIGKFHVPIMPIPDSLRFYLTFFLTPSPPKSVKSVLCRFLSFFCLHCPSNTKCHVRASNAPACQRFKTSLVCLVLVEGCDGPAVPGWIQEEEGPQGEASQDTENHAQILSRILGPSLSAILGPRLWVSPLRLENKFFGNLSRRSLVHFFLKVCLKWCTYSWIICKLCKCKLFVSLFLLLFCFREKVVSKINF